MYNMEQRETSHLWTIKELGQQVARSLADDYQEPANRQIRAIPDRRTIRYYTTLGLLDRPARMRGRTALYGHRHLLQVVAIKRLQAGGLSLARIQEELAGLPDAALARLARLPGTGAESLASAREVPPAEDTPGRRRQRFWGEVPDAETAPAAPTPPTTPGEPVTSLLAEGTQVARLTALSLAPGATLLLDTERQVGGPELEAVRTAATALVEQLKHLGLLPESAPRGKGVTP